MLVKLNLQQQYGATSGIQASELVPIVLDSTVHRHVKLWRQFFCLEPCELLLGTLVIRLDESARVDP